jgi:sulfinoalanine decarboxylase/sulfinoalanine decarboxylase/aspartate 1-decarboxylase
LKLWTHWKSVGRKGIEAQVDHQFYLGEVAREYIRSNSNYTLYSYEPSLNICFNYKGISPDILCSKLYEHSKLMVGFGEFQDQSFVRLVTINSNNSKEDILQFFKTLEAFADSHF